MGQRAGVIESRNIPLLSNPNLIAVSQASSIGPTKLNSELHIPFN